MEVIPYTSHDFNTQIPTFEDAYDRFWDIDGQSIVENDIRKCFIDNKMEYTFGLTIAHRHFDLNPNERLVAYGNTSSPWADSDDEDIMKPIKPTSWRLGADGKVQAFEFEFNIKNESALDPTSQEQAAFVQKLVTLLKEKEALGLFGICKYPGDDFQGQLEISQGRANINLKEDEHNYQDLPQSEATWYFSPALQFKRCSCSVPSAGGQHRHYGCKKN